MRPLFNDLSVSHDEDAIRLPDGGEPVRNNKAGAALHHSGKRALHIISVRVSMLLVASSKSASADR